MEQDVLMTECVSSKIKCEIEHEQRAKHRNERVLLCGI
jgi:hypothetical protein